MKWLTWKVLIRRLPPNAPPALESLVMKQRDIVDSSIIQPLIDEEAKITPD